MVSQRILIGKIDPHRILLVKLHQSLVDNHASRSPKGLVESLDHLIKLCWNLRLWNTLTPKMVVHNITNTRPHGLQCRVEAVRDRIMESRDEGSSQSGIPTERTPLRRIRMVLHARILNRPSETKQLLSFA